MMQQFLAGYFHYFVFLAVALLLLFLHKIGFYREIASVARENRLFFFVLLLAGAIASLSAIPFQPLVYYDEQAYLIEAKNLAEHGTNSICNIEKDGECIHYSIAPHGLGASSIYSLLYTSDFGSFYLKIAIFSLVFYLLNSVIIFALARKLSLSENAARISAILVLAFPYSIIFSTNAMPAILPNTFFLISAYSFVSWLKNKNKEIEVQFALSLTAALLILVSIRMEYAALLALAPIYGSLRLYRYRAYPKKNSDKLTVLAIATIILAICAHFAFYAKQKLFSPVKWIYPKIGPDYFNISYFQYYISGWAFILLTFFFVYFLIAFTVNARNLRKNNSIAMIIFVIIFSGYLAFYSFYNFPSVFRFIIPISSIYIIFASAGMDSMLSRFIVNPKYVKLIAIAIVVIMASGFLKEAHDKKVEMMLENEPNAHFIEIIGEDVLKANKIENDTYLYFPPSYLGEITGIKSFTNDVPYAVSRLEEGRKLIYVNSPFESFDASYFNNADMFAHRLVFNDTRHNFNYYEVKLKRRG